jgi:hypothetical protein
VTPIALKYRYSMLSPSWEVVPFFAQQIMQSCLFFSYKCEVNELPPFLPNEYLYQAHADKGSEKWEIFAWAVRDVMAKVGDFKKFETSFREKLEYETVLGFIKPKRDETLPLLENAK